MTPQFRITFVLAASVFSLWLPCATSVGLRSRGGLEASVPELDLPSLLNGTNQLPKDGASRTVTEAPATTTTKGGMVAKLKRRVIGATKAQRDDRMLMSVAVAISIVPYLLAWALSLTQLLPFKSAYKPGRTEPNWSFTDRLFHAPTSARFADNAQLALRGAVFAVIGALPYVVPSWSWLYEDGRYSSFAVLMFIFTLYKSVGETINFAFMGMAGTFWAVFNIWVMHGIFPGGVANDDAHFIPGVLDFFFFVIAMLGLNVSNGTRVFALSWHVYFMMEFLNPNASGWSVGFAIDRKGPAVSALLQSGIGCGLAVLAVLLPYPIFALDKARVTAIRLCNELAIGWDKCVDCYCAESRKPILEDALRHSLHQLRDIVQDLNANVSNSWWECLGLGRPQRVRLVFNSLDHSFREVYMRLCATLHALQDEDFTDAHDKIMQATMPLLKTLVTESSALYCLVTEVFIDGTVVDADVQKLDAAVAKTVAAIEAVTEKAMSVHNAFNFELADECSFLVSCCAYGRSAIDMADHAKSLRGPNYEKEKIHVTSCFDVPITDLVYRNAVVRNTVSICFAFWFGWHGRGSIVMPYESGIASVVTLLISSSFGSALTNNLGRLQGVVLGCVFGQLAYAFFAWCSLYGQITVSLYVFFWVLVTCFAYFHVRDGPMSTIACLLAAFGATGVLLGCSDDVYNPTGMAKVINTVIGVSIMTISDMLFSVKTASRHAFEELKAAWGLYRRAMHTFFDPKNLNIRKHEGLILNHISTAQGTVALAASEPRFARTPFKEMLFQAVCEDLHELRESISSMESTCSTTGDDTGTKAEWLVAVAGMPEWEAVKKDFYEYEAAVEQVMLIFVHDSEESFFKLHNIQHSEGKCPLDIAKENLEKLSDAITKAVKSSGLPDVDTVKGFKSLENKGSFRMASLLFHLSWQLRVLYRMKHRMLSD